MSFCRQRRQDINSRRSSQVQNSQENSNVAFVVLEHVAHTTLPSPTQVLLLSQSLRRQICSLPAVAVLVLFKRLKAPVNYLIVADSQ